MAKPNLNRQNSALFSVSDDACLWIDYDPATLAVTNITVDNAGDAPLYAEAQTLAKVRGQSLYSAEFAVGVTSVPIPKQANLVIGFDPNDGNAPFLTGLDHLTFREPA